mmetsp:Transcript_30955/g.34249  ORF Transcript_30955/g.34249 Transcript_30955/m.34249 type:complete len:518 (+) Transcript_30955:309-1862(+)
MRACKSALFYLTLVCSSTTIITNGFVSPTGRYNNKLLLSTSSSSKRGASTTQNNVVNNNNNHEFDFLLHENGNNDEIQSHSRRHSHRRVALNPSHYNKIEMTSAVATTTEEAAAALEKEFDAEFGDSEEDDLDSLDEFTLSGMDKSLSPEAIQEMITTDLQNPVIQWFKETPMNEVIAGMILPTGLVSLGLFIGVSRFQEAYTTKTKGALLSYSNEMLYHDGNFGEMELCHKEWSKKLAWLGFNKKRRMLETYLADFAKKKTLTPLTISSISYIFSSLYKLKEVQAAKIVNRWCTRNNRDFKDGSSQQKILFVMQQIFTTKEAMDELKGVRKLLKKAYPEDLDSKAKRLLLKTSLSSVGESAYQSWIQEQGFNEGYDPENPEQPKLPDGWQVLGLTLEKAEEIFTGEKKKSFQTEIDYIYSNIDEKYNKDGQRINKYGVLMDDPKPGEEDDKKEEEEEDEKMGDGVFECGKCSYTLFVAKGRSAKFYGPGFTCPECGVGKDQFFEVEDDDDDDDDDA